MSTLETARVNASEAEILLRLAMEQTSDQACLLLDRNGVIRWCNQTAARMFGYTPPELLALAVHRLCQDHSQPDRPQGAARDAAQSRGYARKGGRTQEHLPFDAFPRAPQSAR